MKSFIPHSLLMTDDMSERKVIKAKSTKKQEEREARSKKVGLEVSLDSQARLAEILNDSPRLVNLAGTEWEVRTLRQKVQWMIAEEVVKIIRLILWKSVPKSELLS